MYASWTLTGVRADSNGDPRSKWQIYSLYSLSFTKEIACRTLWSSKKTAGNCKGNKAGGHELIRKWWAHVNAGCNHLGGSLSSGHHPSSTVSGISVWMVWCSTCYVCWIQQWKNESLEVILLLLHVSEQKQQNIGVMQCLAAAWSPAHVSGILVQTCGCWLGSMGESVSHTLCVAKFWETCEGSFSIRLGECPYLTPRSLLYNSTAGNPGHCAVLAWLTQYVTFND